MSVCDVAKPSGDPAVRDPEKVVGSDSEQLAQVLMTKRARIVKELDVDIVLSGLNTLLSVDSRDILRAEQNRGEKCAKLIECIERKTALGSYELFNAFMKIIAGTQPQLFTSLFGRSPTLSESDFCIESFVASLRENIQIKGHCIDSNLDQKIDLNKEHVELKLRRVPTEDSVTTDSLSRQLPHMYQEYLKRVDNQGQNACDILNPDRENRTVIQGRAGIGKSMTAQHVARQWSLSKWASGFRVLFLLQLRHLMTTEWSMTAVELLTSCAVYQGEEGFDTNVLAAWMMYSANRVIILIDGLDEISGFIDRMKNAPKISAINTKAPPLDLVINILRGNILPKCSIISTSRPFTGLSELQNYSVQEILGLTESGVRQYVQKKHPDRAEHIKSVLSKIPLLMSLCSITVYCMMISTLLNEGVELLDGDVETYSRLTAFILVKYASRKLSDWPFVLEVNSFFSKLAHLAFSGIFQPAKNMSKLVFNEYDLAQSHLSNTDLNAMRKVGILEFKTKVIGQRKTVNAEFLHSTIQEMLAVAHCLGIPSDVDMENLIRNIPSGGQFNMSLMYLFGLHFDTNSVWIKDILVATGCTERRNGGVHLEKLLNDLLQNTDTKPDVKLLICQLVHEGQVTERAKAIHQSIMPNGFLNMANTPMTVLDLKAVNFVCQYAQALTHVQFSNVNADDIFVKILSSSVIKANAGTLQVLDLSNNMIGIHGVQDLATVLTQNRSLHTLNLRSNNLGVESGAAVAELLRGKGNLQVLDIAGCNVGADAAKAICGAIQKNTKLKSLDLRSNNLGVDGAEEVATLLKNNSSLQSVAICGNSIGPKGAKCVMDALHNNKGVRSLHLSNNAIGHEGAKSAAKMLATNTSIRVLVISQNGIGEQGAKALEKFLYNLHTLNMNCNNIGPVGAASIGHALRERNSLNILHLALNNIGTKGARAMALMLKNNDTLQTLDLGCNNIGVQGAKDIAEALQQNQSLQALQLTGSDIGYEGQAVLTLCKQAKATPFELAFNSIDTGQQGVMRLVNSGTELVISQRMNVSLNL